MFAASKTAGAAATGGGAWDVSTATYTGTQNYFRVLESESTPQDLFFKPDGLTMYVVGSGSDTVYQYTLTTAWDLTTATYSGLSKSVSAQLTTPQGLFFKDDGTQMYVCGTTTSKVVSYTLSTAWNVSTAASPVTIPITVDTIPTAIYFRPNGLSFYIIGTSTDYITQYNLTTAWDLTTAVAGADVSIGSQDSTPQGLSFKPDGTKMYVLGGTNDRVYEYDLSPAWFISTASYTGANFYVGAQETSPNGIFFKDDGSSMFIVGSQVDAVFKYNFSVNWNFTYLTYAVSGNYFLYTYAQDATPNGLFFRSDGYQFFTLGTSNDAVFEYTTTSPWDLSTASYSGNSYYIGGYVTSGADLFFSPDGTRYFTVDASTIYRFDISTAWQITSSSYNNAASIAPVGSASALFFKPDGTRLFVIDDSTTVIHTFSLSTPWNLTTLSNLSITKNVSAQDLTPIGLFFKPDGLSMYMLGTSNDTVYQYTLSTAWDVSTATYASKSFSVRRQEGAPQSLFFRDDGTNMYVLGTSYDTIFQYELG